MSIWSSFMLAAGVVDVLFTVVGHASGENAMIGAFFLVAAVSGIAASLQQIRRARANQD